MADPSLLTGTVTGHRTRGAAVPSLWLLSWAVHRNGVPANTSTQSQELLLQGKPVRKQARGRPTAHGTEGKGQLAQLSGFISGRHRITPLTGNPSPVWSCQLQYILSLATENLYDDVTRPLTSKDASIQRTKSWKMGLMCFKHRNEKGTNQGQFWLLSLYLQSRRS